ncbi:hypothetical protein F3Y22_tig00110733pilonHSYRG00088 [Hibiscus syriacus]|uniref:Uncharacterized protein n=1 Tax=Hibiscus syriacus TaxID=106335 RepID=A0A6A2ZTE4_HIBSY|nr:hypothetical protein F3Y22_tig00110733pilonHSYRG00088 [Hibiscus syriacus]
MLTNLLNIAKLVHAHAKLIHHVVIHPIRSFDGMSVDSQKSVITRSLLLDFAEKSYMGENNATKEKADDIDNTFEEMRDEYYEEDDIDDDDGLVDEMCKGLN